MVLYVRELHVSRSLRKVIRANRFRVTLDAAFPDVVRACAEARRDQEGTWITPAMDEAYVRLAELGHAHSVEAWQGDALVGGLYGVAIGRMFFGESMFTRVSDASKVALVRLARQLERVGHADDRLPDVHPAPGLARRAGHPAGGFRRRGPIPGHGSRRCPRRGGSNCRSVESSRELSES